MGLRTNTILSNQNHTNQSESDDTKKEQSSATQDSAAAKSPATQQTKKFSHLFRQLFHPCERRLIELPEAAARETDVVEQGLR